MVFSLPTVLHARPSQCLRSSVSVDLSQRPVFFRLSSQTTSLVEMGRVIVVPLDPGLFYFPPFSESMRSRDPVRAHHGRAARSDWVFPSSLCGMITALTPGLPTFLASVPLSGCHSLFVTGSLFRRVSRAIPDPLNCRMGSCFADCGPDRVSWSLLVGTFFNTYRLPFCLIR